MSKNLESWYPKDVGVSAFGAFAPFSGAVESDRFFVKAAFLLPDGSHANYGKIYSYCISTDIAPPQVGDKIWVDKTCITRRTEGRLVNGVTKDKPYGDSVLLIVDVVVANALDELPDEFDYIDTMNSWVTICHYIKTENNTFTQEEFNMGYNDFMSGMFGPVASGLCKITMDGGIAVKTPSGYKTYGKDGSFVNCDQFVFGGFDEMFFVVPTNNVQRGDIILANGKPKYVMEVKDNMITVVNYDNGNVENMLPERHVFMGNTYFYGKIVSMFGNADSLAGGDGANKVFKFMMMSQMMKGMGGKSSDGMNPMMMMMMMNGGGFGNIFDNVFGSVNPIAPTTAPTPGVGVVPATTDVKEDK